MKKILLSVMFLLFASFGYGQGALAPMGRLQYLTNNGTVAAGYKLCTYVTGGTTPLATYTDLSNVTPNSNPIILDSAGRPVLGQPTYGIYLSAATYRFVLKTAGTTTDCTTGTTIWTQDGVSDIGQILKVDLAATGTSKGANLVGLLDPDGSTARVVQDITSTSTGKGDDLIGYKGTGTGTISRSVHDRLGDLVLSAKDFGAVGDGVTDDTDEIEAANAAAYVIGGGGIAGHPVVYLPKGVYNVKQIRLRYRNALVGDGIYATRIVRIPGGTGPTVAMTTGSIWGSDYRGDASGMVVSDLMIDGSSEEGGTLTVIGASNTTPIVIETSAAHGLYTGNLVKIQNITGNTAANGEWYITRTDDTHFSLQFLDYVTYVTRHSIGNGAYAGAGTFTVHANGLELGTGLYDNGNGTPLALGGRVSNVVVFNATGWGMQIYGNVAKVDNCWAESSTHGGMLFQGTNIYGYYLNSEVNAGPDLRIEAENTTIFGLQIEPTGNLPDTSVVQLIGASPSLYHVYIAVGSVYTRRAGILASAGSCLVDHLQIWGIVPASIGQGIIQDAAGVLTNFPVDPAIAPFNGIIYWDNYTPAYATALPRTFRAWGPTTYNDSLTLVGDPNYINFNNGTYPTSPSIHNEGDLLIANGPSGIAFRLGAGGANQKLYITATDSLFTSNVTAGPLFSFTTGSCTFAELGTIIVGRVKFCTDCNVASPCTGVGAGAWAFGTSVGPAWKCPF